MSPIAFAPWPPGQRLAAERDIPPHVDRVLSKPPKLRELREALTACVSARLAEARPVGVTTS